MKRFLWAKTCLAACLAVVLASGLNAANLLSDTVFALRGVKSLPAGWTTEMQGGATCMVDAVGRAPGALSIKMTAPKGGERAWNMVSRRVVGLKPKTPYTVSAWVKTADMDKGAMAYLSFHCFANSRRLASNDSAMKVSGNHEWTRIVHTIPELPGGTHDVRFIFCLHGGGTAWFAEPQVEEGRVATDYAPAPGDVARAERRTRQAHAAEAWLAARGLEKLGAPRVAVLDLGLKPGRGEFGFVTDPAAFERLLSDDFRVARVSGDDVANMGILSRKAFDLLVVPTGSAFPKDAAETLVDFLQDGGALLTCGGYAFDKPVLKVDGVWSSQEAFAGDIPAGTDALALPSADAWSAGADSAGKTVVSGVVGPNGEKGVCLSTPSLSLWSTADIRLDGMLKGSGVVSFLAKGDATTPNAWFEIAERDGSRWHSKLDLTTEWKEYRLTPMQFTYWSDNPSIGRGFPGDFVQFDNVARLSLGVAIDVAAVGQPHAVSICAVKKGVDPRGAERCVSLPQINTRTAHIRDAIHPEAKQIGVFDPSFDLRHVAEMQSDAAMAGILPTRNPIRGAFTGLSAIAQLGVNGHGFGPNRCCWRPVLACTDAAGNPRGYAGAIVHHYTGTFAGSSWAIFGVDNADLFDPSDASVRAWTVALVKALVSRRFLGNTSAEYACYRVGETMKLVTDVANFAPTSAAYRVVFTLADENGRTVAVVPQTVTASAGKTSRVVGEWIVPSSAPDFLRLTAELQTSDTERPVTVIDREGGAVVIWNDRVLAGGSQVKKEGLRLMIDGESRFFMGCQTFWGQHRSVTASSPERFYQDFKQMRAFGLRWTRCFLPFRNEKEKRDSDAVVQLAQKFGLVLYHTPNLWNTRDAEKLAEQNCTIAEIATRYRAVPGFAIDICNEPFLKEPSSRSATDAQRHWAKTNYDAVKRVRAEVPVSVGWSQGWAGGTSTKDPQVASLDLDFTDRHYYGNPTKVVEQMKDVDLRVLGKPVIIGECGAKNHPTFKSSDPWGMGDDDAGYDERFRYLVSHAFGTGATALLSWHWRDPMEGLFPCGLVHATNVPRPTAHLFGKMARTFGRLTLVDNPPDVVVVLDEDVRQQATPDRVRALDAAYRVDEDLMWWGANWSKLTSSQTAALPPTVKLVIRPEQMPTDAAARRAEIGRLLKAHGASFTRRAEDPDTLETFKVPGAGATGWVFWNGGKTSVDVVRGAGRLTIGPRRVGYLQIGVDGGVQVQEEL